MKVLISISDIFNLGEVKGKLHAILTGDFNPEYTKKVVQEAYDILKQVDPLKDPNCQIYLDNGQPVKDE